MRTGSTSSDPHPMSTQRKTASSRPTARKAAAARQNRKADRADLVLLDPIFQAIRKHAGKGGQDHAVARSEEHTSELQSLMRISYAVFCLKKKTNHHTIHT